MILSEAQHSSGGMLRADRGELRGKLHLSHIACCLCFLMQRVRKNRREGKPSPEKGSARGRRLGVRIKQTSENKDDLGLTSQVRATETSSSETNSRTSDATVEM